MTYAEWIEGYRARVKVLLGACAKATQEMVEAFPELERVPGHIYVMGWGRRAHWWCEDPNGNVVDPTASQFPGGVLHYESFEPGHEVRTGRCMNCGEDLYEVVHDLSQEPRRRTFCDDRCSDEMASAMGW